METIIRFIIFKNNIKVLILQFIIIIFFIYMQRFETSLSRVTLDLVKLFIMQMESKINKQLYNNSLTIVFLKDENTLKYDWSKFIRFQIVNKALDNVDTTSDLLLSHYCR